MAFNISNLSTWITTFTFPAGVQVVDVNKIPASVQDSMLPLLSPNPSGPFITNVSTAWVTFDTSHRTYELRYVLNYVLFFASLGAAGTAIYQLYPNLVSTAMGIAKTFMDHERPDGSYKGAAEWVRLRDVPHFEPVTDTAKTFHGAQYALEVLEICQQGV